MSGEYDKCREHALECECKNHKPWKPNEYLACPECEEVLFISSVVPINGQVNFACLNSECSISGFLHQGQFYFSDGT